MEAVVFWIIAAVMIGSAFAAVMMRNIVHSALVLIITFISIGALYITLNAEFIGLVQVLIYAGAVSIILIFGIMLTHRQDIQDSNPFNQYRVGAWFVSGGLFLLIATAIVRTDWVISDAPMASNYMERIPEIILVDLLIPFQMAGLLLLVAMIGAIVLAKGVKNNQ